LKRFTSGAQRRKKMPISILLYITVDGVILSFNYSE